jgi:drug/metabolite transporter (DMT)-like permease
MSAQLIDESSSPRQVLLLLVLAVSMVSSASILIRLSDSPPLVIVFWRTFYGSIFMASIGLFHRDLSAFRGNTFRQNWRWLVLIGVALSLHFSTWFQSLFLTTVAASVVLVDSSPLVTAVLSTLVLGESLRRRSWAGVIVGVAGVVVLAWGDFGGTNFDALIGDALALAGAFFLALYFIGGRRYARGLPITVYTSVVYFVAAGVTLVLCLSLGYNVLVFDLREVFLFVALALFPTVLGHSVNNYLLTKVPAYVVSSAVLGEPVGAALLAALIFAEYPAPIQLIGFCVILIGVAFVLADIASKEKSTSLPLDDTDWS